MISFVHKVNRFGRVLNKLLEDFAKTKLRRINKTYKINISNYIAAYIDFLPTNIGFQYTINNKKYSIIQGQDDKYYIIDKNNEKYFIHFYLPSSGKIFYDEGSTIINGHNSLSDHKAFLCIISRDEIKQIEPILASSHNYPNNFICGFIIHFENSKYIIFKHSNNTHLNYGNEAVYKHKQFSVLRFEDDMLENIWAFDRKNKLEEY